MDFAYDKERIERLRTEALTLSKDYSQFSFFFHRAMRDRNNWLDHDRAVGQAVKEMYAHVQPSIGECELLVGRMPAWDAGLTDDEKHDWNANLRAHVVPAAFKHTGQASHMTIDFDRLLQKGAEGIMADIRGYCQALDETLPEDAEKHMFYDSCISALEGIVQFAENYAAHAEELAQNASPKRQAELHEIARICRTVPRKPATSFYEAIQSCHFVNFCLSGKPYCVSSHLYQLGRPDRYLWPYYQKDIQSGAITQEFAQTLLDCYGILMNTRINSGLAAGWMVGGRDPKQGKVISNDLTRMGMRTVSHIRMIYPGVGLCHCTDTPAEDLRLACEILSEGHSHPAIFNDDIIAKGLRFHGVAAEDAHEYIHSTCVEITPIATSNVYVASPYTNLTSLLLDVLQDDYNSLDDLLAVYFDKLGASIRRNLRNEVVNRVNRAQHSADPLLSCFVKDCLERGKDIERGGARFNWVMPSFVGLSNLADALVVLEKLVFSGEVPLSELREALAVDWQGFEALHQRVQNQPKYGNDIDDADRYVTQITEWLTSEMAKYQKRQDSYLVPSLFCWIMHDNFGKETGASPDGRRAKFPLGDGSGAAQGREFAGPTAAVLSSTKWDHHKFIGGVAVNMKFAKKMFTPESLENLIAIVHTYLERGGFELQINVVDRDTLLKAVEHPENYRDLVVRIGGYSDYFTRLSASMQQEVLARTEYQI